MHVPSIISLENRRFLVTGAASGLGKATSILLSKLGAELVLVDKDENGLKDTASKCINRSLLINIDLCELGGVKDVLINALKGSRLNGFVHLAGIPCTVPVKSLSLEKCEKVLKINSIAAVELTKCLLDKNISAGPGSSIVLIASVYGLVGSSANVGYAMSKGAIVNMTRSLAIELAPKQIRVNCVAPGFIDTPLMRLTADSLGDDYFDNLASMHPLGLGEPDDIANAIAFFFSDMSKWITGVILPVDGGFTAQ